MSNALLRNSVLLLVFLGLSSCQFFKSKTRELQDDRRQIARVSNYVLYEDDLSGVIHDNMSPEDSIEASNFFINDWVKNRLLLTKSQQYLPEDLEEIDRQAQDYKESLLIYLYETKLIQQNLDTLVNDFEVETYYSENKSKFVLREPIVFMRYYILKPESPQVDSLIYWMENMDEMNFDRLNDYGFQYASKFNVEGEWLKLDEFTRQFPVNESNPRSFVQNNSLVELSDEKNLYVMQFDGFISENEVAPLAYKRKEIEKIIIKLRKMRYTKEIKNKIYEDALKKEEFEIYENS